MKPGNPKAVAFTLVEVMAAMTVLTLILVVIFGMVQQTSNAWKNSRSKIESFQNARLAFESMTRRLSMATLNSYYGYDNASDPTRYLRKSELHFVSGKSLLPGRQVTHAVFFQAPLGYTDISSYSGLDNLLNACGYFVEHGRDDGRPTFLSTLPNPRRFRLMQFEQPAQNLAVYDQVNGSGNTWFTTPLAGGTRPVHELAENIVALVIRPKRSEGDEADASEALAPGYEYDTRAIASPIMENQLPPLIEVVLFAIDGSSALRLGDAADLGQSVLFQTAIQQQDLDSDIIKMEQVLQAEPDNIAANVVRLNYRVFRAEVAIRTAKWSTYD